MRETPPTQRNTRKRAAQMHDFPATSAVSGTRTHPALRSLAVDCRDTTVRLLAYLGALALIGFGLFAAVDPLADAAVSAAATAWTGPAPWSTAVAIPKPELRGTGRANQPPGAPAAADWISGGLGPRLRGALPPGPG